MPAIQTRRQLSIWHTRIIFLFPTILYLIACGSNPKLSLSINGSDITAPLYSNSQKMDLSDGDKTAFIKENIPFSSSSTNESVADISTTKDTCNKVNDEWYKLLPIDGWRLHNDFSPSIESAMSSWQKDNFRLGLTCIASLDEREINELRGKYGMISLEKDTRLVITFLWKENPEPPTPAPPHFQPGLNP
jgi:hypothetical protein